MNYNNLSERTNFIAGSSKFKHIPFFLVHVNLPDISLSHPSISGGRFSHNMKLPGDTIQYGTLSFEMLVDEDLLIYEEFYNLVKSNTNPETNTFGDFSFDFFIEMRSNQGHPVLVFEFENCRITSIGSLQLETSDDSNHYRLSVELTFDKFYPVRKKKYNLIGEYDVVRPRPFPAIHSDFSKLEISDFLIWGSPLPSEMNDSEMNSWIGLSSISENESGLILKDPVPERIDFKFEFMDNDNIVIGITEGSGVESSVYGRTGKSLFEYSPKTDVILNVYKDYILITDLDKNKLKEFNIETIHTEYFLFVQGTSNSSGTPSLFNCFHRK